MKLLISVARQLLTVFDDAGKVLREYPISTAKAGVGEISGSYQTPRGRHVIRAKIGASQPENTVFVRRRPTGETWTPKLLEQFPGRDWILTRILFPAASQGVIGSAASIPCAAMFTSTAARILRKWAFRVRMAAYACAMRILSNYSIWCRATATWKSPKTEVPGRSGQSFVRVV